MCLAANVILIESGTTGFNGQVQVIKKVIGPGFTSVVKLIIKRVKPNATIATPKKPPRVIQFVLSEAPLARLFIALFGPKVISLRVCILTCSKFLLIFKSEIFGTSEDDVPEFDHSEDSENGETDIVNL